MKSINNNQLSALIVAFNGLDDVINSIVDVILMVKSLPKFDAIKQLNLNLPEVDSPQDN